MFISFCLCSITSPPPWNSLEGTYIVMRVIGRDYVVLYNVYNNVISADPFNIFLVLLKTIKQTFILT